MTRILAFLYGSVVYLMFLGVFLYAVGFIGNLLIPKSIDRGGEVLGGPALLINLGLLSLFALQHSIMARPAFKRVWTRIVPEPVERSTYVLLTNLVLILLFWQWRPMTGIVWSVENAAGAGFLWALYALGWLIVLASTYMIDHFDLFGMRQVWFHLRGEPYSPPVFQTNWMYNRVRHPLYVGWITVFWATPQMTTGHLLFAAVATAYIFVAIRFEERDLVTFHGPDYEAYRQKVSMIIPSIRSRL